MDSGGTEGRSRAIRTRLNLATAPLENSRRFYAIAAVMGIPALALCFHLSVSVAHDRAASSERRLEAERLEREMDGYRSRRAELEEFFSVPATRLVTQRAAFLNTIIDERSFPWTDFFVDLEKRLPGGVHVIQVVPTLAGDHLEMKLRVGALSDKSKLEFLQALETAPEFSRIELLSETRSAKNQERDVVQMDLTAEYRPVAAPGGQARGESGGAQ